MLKSIYSMVSLFVLVFAIGFVSPSYAQEKIIEPLNLTTLKVVSPSGEWAIVTVFEGEKFSITDQKSGTDFVFVPIVADAKNRTVEVKVFRAADAKTDENSTENLIVAMGSPKDTQASYKVELKAIAQHLPD